MECPCLEKISICNASMAPTAPTVYETKTYCMADGYYCCPTMLAYVLGTDRDEMPDC